MRRVEEVVFDWNDALGDTVMEKYEALYIVIYNNFAKLPPDKGVLTVQCAETIASMFEMTSSWQYQNQYVVPFYVNSVLRYMGEINGKWALWCDSFMPSEELWLYNDEAMIKVLISNFVV